MSRDGDACGGDRVAPLETRPDFFAGASHQEALARLEYLVETGLRCGVVVGPKGAGKTFALRAFAAQPAVVRTTKILVDLHGLDAAEGLKRLGQKLGITSHARGHLSGLWQEVTDALSGRLQAKRQCVVMFDHLDRSLADCQQAVERLVMHNDGPGAATFVLGFSGSSYPLIARQWRQAADLRIELSPLTAEETAEFIEQLLRSFEMPTDAFDAAASEILFRLTRGVPRDIVRLCELSLLSAMQDDQRSVSADVVQAAMHELSLLRASA
jgi:general secretion pathway protein A